MPRKRTWALEFNDTELFDLISDKLNQNTIWKDICKFFGVKAKNISTVWSWYNRRKKKVNGTQVQTYAATTSLPYLTPLPGGVPPPPPSGGVAPPPPPPAGQALVKELSQEEMNQLAYIKWKTNKSKKRFGALDPQPEARSIDDLQDLQAELFSKLQVVAATS